MTQPARVPWSRRRFQCAACGYALLRVGQLKRRGWWLTWRRYAIWRSRGRHMRLFECADDFACYRRQRDKVAG